MRLDLQPRDRNRQLKATWPGTPGIQKQHSAPPFDRRLMRMPEDHRRDPCSLGIEIEPLHIVEHVYVSPTKLYQLRCRQSAAWAAFIDIAPNCRDWRDSTQRVQNRRITNIAGVKDVLRSPQRLDCGRPQQPMRVGDHANPHRYRPTAMRVRGSR